MRAARPKSEKSAEPAEVLDISDEVARQSSGQKVYALLREQILNLDLPPNTELDEVQFSRELGFSRTPIREALIRLASDSLVVLAPNRGARVAPLDLDQVPQVLEALELYERATTRWAALRRQPHHLDLLEQRNREFAAASETRDPRLIVEANWAFHDAINQACGNKFLAADCSKMLRGVMRLSLLAFRQNGAALLSYSDVIDQHNQMIDAISRGDANEAERLVYEHSDEFRERMKTFVAGASTADFLLNGRG
ncbi:GntR family transcriptional regulator [Sphingopyxis sp. PAMC25046]|uniref:GntR family transcriptional regulator n=1 Tax=Sphingopyxis sp. PAMC25046 TaxID=2565556 RepID=UPI00109E171C|nr:GntR family transcriptional regulator [Sphingopyxis sp. PAMC25046]QCB54562.1 GntR family transcriptional regulator [Sphingopyxis sp. PAMC25046]